MTEPQENNNHSEQTISFYNKFAKNFDYLPFRHRLPPLIEQASRAAPNNLVLDIGSGAGAAAALLEDRGQKVTCLDPSEAMIKLCQGKGLDSVQSTIQDFTANTKYGTILALSSLIHVPYSEYDSAIEKITNLLAPGGHFIFSFLKGSGETICDPCNNGADRFFSFIEKNNLEKLLSSEFEVLSLWEHPSNEMGMTFFLGICRKLS